jgi:type VI secretion system protein ImpM
VTGLYGKMPRHGDFVRRDLPGSFVGPWDAWLAAGVSEARETLGEAQWETAWEAAPAWRFRLAPGACGPEPAAGVLLMSEDMVGRRFPLTVAALLDHPDMPQPDWFDTIEAAARAARAGELDADGLAAALPPAPPPDADDATLDARSLWWTAGGARVASGGLPPPLTFLRLLEAA